MFAKYFRKEPQFLLGTETQSITYPILNQKLQDKLRVPSTNYQFHYDEDCTKMQHHPEIQQNLYFRPIAKIHDYWRHRKNPNITKGGTKLARQFCPLSLRKTL